jgi:DMSO/TMAO reductase YedYZ molybdopterin-dependent catalytic subunit
MSTDAGPEPAPAEGEPGRAEGEPGRAEGEPGRAEGEPGRAEHGVPGGAAVLASVLAVGAALGVGHLVAGLVSPPSSPYQAVADAVVRLAPPGLVEVGKSLSLPGLPAGRADKVALLVGVGVVVLVFAVLAGLASRRDPRPGRWALVALGLVGLAAVVNSPVFTPAGLVAPLAALGTALWVFGRLRDAASAPEVASGRTPARAASPSTAPGQVGAPVGTAEVSRRRLLMSSAAVGVGAAGAGLGGYLLGAGTNVATSDTGLAARLRPARPAPPPPKGADFAAQGTPTFLTANRDFYRIDTALRLPATPARDWSMRVHGMVDRELTVGYRDLLDRPLVERPVTLACVSNEVGGDLISTANFVGVSLRDLLLEAGVHPEASQLLSTSLDGFTAGTPIDVVLEPDRGAMLALGMNGEPLPLEHGYPVRMVVPGLYGFVSATKWLADLELTTFEAKTPYWAERGWARFAPIKTQSRIDRPRSGAVVRAGSLAAAGIAWAQHRGVAGVEVRLDDGPWRPAELSTEVSRDTWRMWRIELPVAPGEHRLTCRATDTAGQTQTPLEAPPVPDGATGWPTITFTAR